MEYTYDYQNNIKTTEYGNISDEFYGNPEYLPSPMRGYKRYRGLEYHEFETIAALGGKKYAERIRNYLVSDPKYKDEILFNKKIDRFISKLRGSEFTFAIDQYEYYYHAKFMRFINELPNVHSHLKSSSIGDYFIHIVGYIFQTVKKRRMSAKEMSNLKERLNVGGKNYFKKKAELVEGGIISSVYFDNKLNEKMVSIERAGSYIQRFEEYSGIDATQFYRKIPETYSKYNMDKQGVAFRPEVLFTFTLLDNWEFEQFIELSIIADSLGLESDESSKFIKKFHQVKLQFPELRELYNSMIKVDHCEYLTKPVDHVHEDVMVNEIVSANEDHIQNVTVSAEVVGTLKPQKRQISPMAAIDDNIEEIPELIWNENLDFSSELAVPSQGFIQIAMDWVRRKSAVILADDADWLRFEKQLSNYEFGVLRPNWVREYNNDRALILLSNKKEITSPHPILRYNFVDLNFETLTLENYKRYQPDVPGILLEQQANYLLPYARNTLHNEKIILVSKILVHTSLVWIAWTVMGPKLLGRSEDGEYQKEGKMDLYFGDKGAKVLSSIEALDESDEKILWFGSYKSLYAFYASIGIHPKLINNKIRERQVTLVPHEYFNTMDKLSLFLKYQMPALGSRTRLVFPEFSELILSNYISDDLKAMSPYDIQEQIYNRRFNEFEAEFVEKYGVDYRSKRLNERIRVLDYTPSIIEKATILEEVEADVDSLWELETKSFNMEIWMEVTKIFQDIQRGNYWNVESKFSHRVQVEIMKLLETIEQSAIQGDYNFDIYVESAREYDLKESKLLSKDTSSIPYKRELSKLGEMIIEKLKGRASWNVHCTNLRNRDAEDYVYSPQVGWIKTKKVLRRYRLE